MAAQATTPTAPVQPAEPVVAAAVTTPTPEATGRVCSNCGAALVGKFCTECGTNNEVVEQPVVEEAVEAAKVFCANCGKEVPAGAKFCTECGTAVNQ